LVIEDGGDEDEAIAALLHDAVEDQGGLRDPGGYIRQRFGERVAAIVEGCSDTIMVYPKPSWRERKAGLPGTSAHTATAGVRRVSLADKLHNASSILADLEQDRGGGLVAFQRRQRGFSVVLPISAGDFSKRARQSYAA
jgi:(p)ppGpp synthase/HD superfamily hydrolase